jgi:hypothetical protein
MKYIVSIFLSGLLTYAVGIYGNLPWWSFVITNLLIAIALPMKPAQSFVAGALGVGSLWAGLAFGIDICYGFHWCFARWIGITHWKFCSRTQSLMFFEKGS